MDAQQQKTYDNYQAMFATEGWKQFIETCKEYKKNLVENSWGSLTDMDKVGQAKGQMFALNMVLNLEAEVEELANPPSEDDEPDYPDAA